MTTVPEHHSLRVLLMYSYIHHESYDISYLYYKFLVDTTSKAGGVQNAAHFSTD